MATGIAVNIERGNINPGKNPNFMPNSIPYINFNPNAMITFTVVKSKPHPNSYPWSIVKFIVVEFNSYFNLNLNLIAKITVIKSKPYVDPNPKPKINFTVVEFSGYYRAICRLYGVSMEIYQNSVCNHCFKKIKTDLFCYYTTLHSVCSPQRSGSLLECMKMEMVSRFFPSGNKLHLSELSNEGSMGITVRGFSLSSSRKN